MPDFRHIPEMTTYQEGGNLPFVTPFEMAVTPTPSAEAISLRPSASAIVFASSMTGHYPPFVDHAISTNGGLPKNPPSVNTEVMTDRPDYSEIGTRLGKIREGFSDLSQKEWAQMNNFSHTQYNNWEKGTRRISVDAAEVLVERYGLTLDFIYRGRMDGLSETVRKVL